MIDLSSQVKGSIIAHLANDPTVTALVPAERIFAMQTPAEVQWPFIRYGSPVISPYEASCWDGTQIGVTLHAFAEGAVGVAGETAVSQIAATVVVSLQKFAPQTFGLLANDWTQTLVLQEDGEADRWHAVIQFNVIAVVEAEAA